MIALFFICLIPISSITCLIMVLIKYFNGDYDNIPNTEATAFSYSSTLQQSFLNSINQTWDDMSSMTMSNSSIGSEDKPKKQKKPEKPELKDKISRFKLMDLDK